MARRGLPPWETHCVRGQPGPFEAHPWIDFCLLYKFLNRKFNNKSAIFICNNKPFLAIWGKFAIIQDISYSWGLSQALKRLAIFCWRNRQTEHECCILRFFCCLSILEKERQKQRDEAINGYETTPMPRINLSQDDFDNDYSLFYLFKVLFFHIVVLNNHMNWNINIWV